ncbi:MAG: ion transporter [Myxococcota bacterium]|nr:ion transporter [Myxococcota bacterium]
MPSQPLRQRLAELVNRLDMLLVALATINVCLYLLELLTVWEQLGIRWLYEPLMLACDVVFIVDLLAKLAVKSRYVRSPWFAIDFLSCLPALSILSNITAVGLNFGFFRLFRVLRALRLLRTLRSFQVIGSISNEAEEEIVSSRVRRGISWLSFISALALMGLSHQIRLLAGNEQQADFMEATLLLGALMGISLTLLLLQLQLPKMTTARIRALVQVALPGQIADRLLTDPGIYRRTAREPATVIFCDIVGFTETVERLDGDLEALKNHLECALNAVTDQHLEHDLIIDKFIGDAVMSFRGGELVEGTPVEHAVAVVRAALRSHSAMWALNDPYFQDIKIGGASTDAALIGSFGTSRRLTYTVLGDRINLAARLEAAVKQCGTRNLFCRRTHALTATSPDILWRRFGWLKVPGKLEAVEVYEALDPDWEADWTWLSSFHEALELFEAGALEDAAALFERADAERESGDVPSQRYLSRARAGGQGPFRTEK